MLLAFDLHKDFIDEEGIALSSVLALQRSMVYSAEFDTPSSNSLLADSDTPLGQQIVDISMAGTEPVIEPNCIGYCALLLPLRKRRADYWTEYENQASRG